MTATAEPTVQDELSEDYALPELAETMEEAEARARASTFLRVLGHVQKEQAANEEEYGVLRRYYAEQHEMRQQKLDRQREWLFESLQRLFGMMDAGSKKSLNLLGGTIGHRKQSDELVVEDDEAVMLWANTTDTAFLLRTKQELNRKGLRTWLQDDASMHHSKPPGVELVERPDVFFASPK